MKSFLLKFAVGLTILLLASCISEVDINTDEAQRILVIGGSVSTVEGPHEVVISKSAKYGSILEEQVLPETNALVYVRDENGEQVFFTEVSPGRYQTPEEYKAEVGKKYTLFITLANGENYVSLPEEILPTPEIDELFVEFVKRPGVDEFTFESGVEVFARFQDPEDEQNFYLWEANGTYIANTRPDLFLDRNGFGEPFPAPKDCCDRCYAEERDINQLKIYKDNLTNGDAIIESVSFIQDNGFRLDERYMVAIEQHGITKEAFQFFELLKNQLSIQGDIFDPPPATIRGNMINLDDPDSEVIGYFYATDVFRDTIYIDESIVTEKQVEQTFNDDCRTLDFSSVNPPDYWIE